MSLVPSPYSIGGAKLVQVIAAMAPVKYFLAANHRHGCEFIDSELSRELSRFLFQELSRFPFPKTARPPFQIFLL